MDEAALWELMNAGRDRMNFTQKRFWDLIRISPEKWAHHSLEGSEQGVWVVAMVGRSVVSYNDFEHGFDRSGFTRYGEIAEFGWGQADLEVAVQHILNDLEIGYSTTPRASSPQPGEFPDSNSEPER